MAESPARSVSPKNIVIDGVLVVAAFGLFFWLATTHVPSEDPIQVNLWSAYCAACMTGVFWIALQMFKAVYRHQCATAKAED